MFFALAGKCGDFGDSGFAGSSAIAARFPIRSPSAIAPTLNPQREKKWRRVDSRSSCWLGVRMGCVMSGTLFFVSPSPLQANPLCLVVWSQPQGLVFEWRLSVSRYGFIQVQKHARGTTRVQAIEHFKLLLLWNSPSANPKSLGNPFGFNALFKCCREF